jgi:glutathione S-transferase
VHDLLRDTLLFRVRNRATTTTLTLVRQKQNTKGRAEVARLLFTLAGAEFVDKRITFDEWRGADGAALKEKTPFGQLPVLQLDDGSYQAQSAAIDRYVAATTGQLPSDPLAAARADEIYFFSEDVWLTVAPTNRLPDAEAKVRVCL